MKSPVHNSLSIVMCQDGADAVAQGFDWKNVQPMVKPAFIQKVVVVRNGTVSGRPTVDLVF